MLLLSFESPQFYLTTCQKNVQQFFYKSLLIGGFVLAITIGVYMTRKAEGENQPYVPANPFGVNQEYWERIQGMRLMDDALMQAALDGNIEATQCILRIILRKNDLIVTSVKAQVNYKNLYGRSLTIDVDAVDSDGVAYDIEVERSKYRATPRRLRHHAAVRDTQFLKEGEDVEKLPVSYIIFITEKDVWNMGLPLYKVTDRTPGGWRGRRDL